MNRLVVFGPSQVDISAVLSKEDIARFDHHGLTPGSWRELKSFAEVVEFAHLLAHQPGLPTDVFDRLSRANNCRLNAGSSTLGMLCAFPSEMRGIACYTSILAFGSDGLLDPFSAFFDDQLQRESIAHSYSTAPGTAPVGFVLSTNRSADRILATHAGVASVAPDWLPSHGDCLVIDAYELRSDRVSAWFAKASASGAFVCLSLGSQEVLTGKVAMRVRSAIESGKVLAIAGSVEEYRTLFEELDPHFATADGFDKHPIRELVPYSLVTFGARGLAGNFQSTYVQAAAVPVDPDRIVNTSGAGDTAAGRFFGGVVGGEDPIAVVEDCAKLAADVLTTRSSRLSRTAGEGP